MRSPATPDRAEWKSRPAGRGKLKAAWLADAIARVDKKKASPPRRAPRAQRKRKREEGRSKRRPLSRSHLSCPQNSRIFHERCGFGGEWFPSHQATDAHGNPSHAGANRPRNRSTEKTGCSKSNGTGIAPSHSSRTGKCVWSRAIKMNLTGRYPELKDLPQFVKAKNAILDGEVVALDEEGKPSFSLMQQRTGIRPHGKRSAPKADVPVLYYAFDLIYLDGEDWRRGCRSRNASASWPRS